ncbi:Fe-S cluster assembly protein SufD [Microvirga sp. W0021]|uniref:Fe-S cluster assembly protein SufD n=1 Tax=Hohaiivirga grylli TaxID=3133970 RepID=A0ABV0BJR9_9HYPH
MTTALKSAGEQKLAEHFNNSKANLPGLTEMRQSAFDKFAAKGLPNKRVEEFKYTDVRSFWSEVGAMAPIPQASDVKAAEEGAHFFSKLNADCITLVDGHFSTGCSVAGVQVLAMADALQSKNPILKELGSLVKVNDNPLYQLNSALMADGVVIRVGKGVKLDKPLHLRFLNSSKALASASRVLVLVEQGAEITILETHESRNGIAAQLNDVAEFIIANDARVQHVRVNAEGQDALAFSTLTARIGAHAYFSTVNNVFGSKVARHQVYLAFEGEKSSAVVNGTALLTGSEHSDSTLVVDHIAPGCDSRELFKTVIDDEAVGVFQGRINVDPEAQKTDGKMMSACLLLSDNGAMYNKPELEIFADDVQCGHGATCGALDEELLFYLESRGLPRVEAESLLIQAFVGEVIEMVENEDVKDELIAHLSNWLMTRR